MKRLIPALVMTTASLGLSAQTTGILRGTVKDSKGNPIAGASILLKRSGMDWSKTLTSETNGSYIQVGLEPKEYEITVSANGYAPLMLRDRVRLGEPTHKDFVLLTAQEAIASGQGGAAPDPGAKLENEGLQAYNEGVIHFNARSYTEAIPKFETAIKSLNESLAKTTDETARVELEKKITTAERVFAFSLVESSKENEDRKVELSKQALPLLRQAIARDSKDQNALIYFVLSLKNAGESAEAEKYQLELDKLMGPNAGATYNKAVEAFNAGNMKDARPFLLSTLDIDPKYADAFYLLAMCDYAEMNLKGAKQNLMKYLEIAPTGKNADTAKAMLADPSLKNIK